MEVRVAEIPRPYKDVAELLERDDGEARYEAMIREARPGLAWMIAHLDDVRGHDLASLEGTIAACEDLVEILVQQHPIARGHYVREFAARLGVDEREVRQALNEAVLRRTRSPSSPPRAPRVIRVEVR